MLHDPQQESRLIGMSDNQYRQWNGAQWMVWDGAQWLPERQPYQPAKPISDKTRVWLLYTTDAAEDPLRAKPTVQRIT